MIAAHHWVHPTPLGDALVVTSDAGLIALEVLDGPVGDALAHVSALLGAVPAHGPDQTAAVCAELDAYFAGTLRSFSVPIDWRLVDGFVRRALQAVCEIPFGETASYGEVAIMAGSPGAHRAAGSACARTPVSLIVPAHRVVRADGSIGEYGGHRQRKRFLLDLEARVVGRARATEDARAHGPAAADAAHRPHGQ